MLHSSSLDEDDLCRSPSRVFYAATSNDPHIVYRTLILVVFLSLLLNCLVACEIDLGNAYSPSPTPTPAHVQIKSATPTPTTRPKPTLSPSPTPTSTSTPSPTPTSVTLKDFEETALRYANLVRKKQYPEAYGILSPDLQAQEPYSVFLHDQNFTLSSGCWVRVNIFAHQIDSQTAIVNIELVNVSCKDNKPIAYYDWIMHVQLQDGRFVITSIGLYASAPAN